MWPFNRGDCLIEVTAWAGLTVTVSLFNKQMICYKNISVFPDKKKITPFYYINTTEGSYTVFQNINVSIINLYQNIYCIYNR